MSSLFCKLNIGAAVATAMLISMPVQGASDSTKCNAEAQQSVEVTTPEARYRLSRREAYAAYEEARNACRQTSSTEQTACMRDAKKQLQDDPAYAKVQHHSHPTSGCGLPEIRNIHLWNSSQAAGWRSLH
ncbi:hypothetical protein ACFQUU_12745 [Herbaspirillum sp. GCM10030257]|uniref:hypothetical protein n=1 Tax=Herbaspirillum sp. GCM10030257 TaxID=3273393 RepID=UPI00361D1E81